MISFSEAKQKVTDLISLCDGYLIGYTKRELAELYNSELLTVFDAIFEVTAGADHSEIKDLYEFIRKEFHHDKKNHTDKLELSSADEKGEGPYKLFIAVKI